MWLLDADNAQSFCAFDSANIIALHIDHVLGFNMVKFISGSYETLTFENKKKNIIWLWVRLNFLTLLQTYENCIESCSLDDILFNMIYMREL